MDELRWHAIERGGFAYPGPTGGVGRSVWEGGSEKKGKRIGRKMIQPLRIQTFSFKMVV